MKHTLARAFSLALYSFTFGLGCSDPVDNNPQSTDAKLPPIVVFPAFHFTTLEVSVSNQTAFPECPASGMFEDWFGNQAPSTVFDQVCRDKLMTLVVDPDMTKPMANRFQNMAGVSVTIKNQGKTASAPFYEDLYKALEVAGNVRDTSIRVAGYDSRLTPDMDGFVERTMALIEETYAQNQNTPVHLVGHSNGPLYMQYLLTHTTKEWKDKYIHGMTPFAGNWVGQGFVYMILFTGINTIDFKFPADLANAASSAAMYLTHPSTYMSLSDPAIFTNQEVVVRLSNGGKEYTPQDNLLLFQDAALPLAKELAAYYTGFVDISAAAYPNIDVYAEKGSGLDTVVGVELSNLTGGQLLADPPLFITRLGDANQEDITNDSIAGWKDMPCHRFQLTDNPAIDHFALPGNPAVLERLVSNMKNAKSICP
jgi:lecithin-cholesterol acyltransferase